MSLNLDFLMRIAVLFTALKMGEQQCSWFFGRLFFGWGFFGFGLFFF